MRKTHRREPISPARPPRARHRQRLALVGGFGLCAALSTPIASCGSSADNSGSSAGSDAGAVGGSGGSAGSAGTGASAGTGNTPGGGGSPSGGGATGTGGVSSGGAAGSGGAPNGWQLVWSDEFDSGSAKQKLDGSKWEFVTGCWGGGNKELQCYESGLKNAYLTQGALHIVALDDKPSGAIGGPKNDPKIVSQPYSSARLRTRGKGDFKYGRMEIRAKLPFGKGLWPAIWMLSTNDTYGGWAASGEIDIMEAINLKAPGFTNEVHGTLHFGGSWPDNVHAGTKYTSPMDLTKLFHNFAVEWEEGEIRWFSHGVHYATQTNWNTSGSSKPNAPFDQKFHLILNVAVGGNWPGAPNAATNFPQEMVVDYVRVYECPLNPSTGKGCGTADPKIKPL